MKSRIINYSFMILLLAAHFSRANNDILAVLTLAIPLLLFIKQKWVIDTLQAISFLSALIWMYGGYQYIQLRIETGDDWLRLLIIMGGVALYSLWSGYWLRSPQIKETYGASE